MYERITLFMGRALTTSVRELVSDLKREEGQGVTEYGMALAFVAVALAAILALLKTSISDFITKVGNDINDLPGTV